MFSRILKFFKKYLKPNMEWFLWGGLVLFAFGTAYMLWPPSEQASGPLKFHDQKDLATIQEIIREKPKQVKYITFVREKGRESFPGKVTLDAGNENYWSELAGDIEYKRISETADKNGVAINNVILEPSSNSWFIPLLLNIGPILLIFMVGSIVLSKMMGGKAAGANNTKATLTRLDQAANKVTLDDVAGIDDEKTTLRELVMDLKHPEMLTKLGGEIPRGVLLTGYPGVGKTFIVRAIAGETGFPVLAGAGSDFVEQYVGVGAGRVRDAFKQARKLRDELNCWVILFIDELTTIGKDRAMMSGPGGSEHQQTVDALLVELNGAGAENDRILFIGATNQPEGLDKAMTRSGRLGDLIIEIGKPDKKGRVDILTVKLKKVPTAGDVDVEKLASEMTGMTGADIETLVKKRAPARARRRLFATVAPAVLLNPDGFNVKEHFQEEDFRLTMDDLWLSLMEMVLGNISETKGRRIDPAVKKMIAYHEAGHLTLAMRKLLQNTGEWDGQYGDDITDISILGPNGVGGFVRTNPKHEFGTAKYMKSKLAVFHAGNVAERLFCGDTTGGCQNDLQQSNRLIKAMLLQLNMSHAHNFKNPDGTSLILPAISVDQQGGSRFLGGEQTHAPQYGMSDFSASQVDKLIGVFLDEAGREAAAYLEQERGWIEFFVPKLVEKERMRFAEIKELWDEYHGVETDLSKAFAFTYEWDANHTGRDAGPNRGDMVPTGAKDANHAGARTARLGLSSFFGKNG